MPGSASPAATWPRPLRLSLRLLVAALLMLGSLQLLGHRIVAPLVQPCASLVTLLDDAFVVTDARIAREAGSDVLRIRANLSRPLLTGGKIVYPFGWGTMPAGGYQVVCTVSSTLIYSALVLIIALAWPALSAREYLPRLLVGLILSGLLLLLTLPTTVIAELQHIAETLADPRALGGWMILSRLLMGGGGLALSIALAAVAISAGRWLDDFFASARRVP
jgi:hypothetical protein